MAIIQTKQKLLAHLYIQCALKNTILSLTDFQGNVYKQWSSKSLQKTDLKKNTPYNLQLITKRIRKLIILKKIKFIKIYIKGKGNGRYNIIYNLNPTKFRILSITDQTFLPFNGCRQSKKKRR